MANQSKLKKKNYDVNKIPEAIAAIKNGMLIKDASVIYGIPRSTLSDKLHKKYASGKTQPGMLKFMIHFIHFIILSCKNYQLRNEGFIFQKD